MTVLHNTSPLRGYEGKYQLDIEIDDTVYFTSEPLAWKKPEEVSTIYIDNKEYPSIFGELRKLEFCMMKDEYPRGWTPGVVPVYEEKNVSTESTDP